MMPSHSWLLLAPLVLSPRLPRAHSFHTLHQLCKPLASMFLSRRAKRSSIFEASFAITWARWLQLSVLLHLNHTFDLLWRRPSRLYTSITHDYERQATFYGVPWQKY